MWPFWSSYRGLYGHVGINVHPQQCHITVAMTAMTSMKHIFEFEWRNELNRTTSRNKTTEGNKLRTFYTFKKKFVYEKYLDLQGDFTLRKNITKLRISSHQLEIERGRYCSKERKQERVEKEKRQCKNCSSGEVEDEEHVVMMCPKYDHARRTMLNSLTEAFPPLENLTKHETFSATIGKLQMHSQKC